MEQYTRQKVSNQLEKLGYILVGSKKNVFQEEPRTKEEKEKLGGSRPDYVIYASSSDRYEPLAIIEAKSYRTRGLDNALLQAEHYALKLKAPLIFATDGVYFKTKQVISGSALIYNGEPLSTLVKEEILLSFLENHAVDTLSKQSKMLHTNLISVFKQVNNLLRKNGLTAGNERFTEFATILFIKLFSEKEEERGYAKLSKLYTWNYLKNVPSEDLLQYFSNLIFPAVSDLYKDKDVFTSSLKINDNKIFKDIYDQMNILNLSLVDEDIKGSAFEYFIANAPSSDKDLGEYFTPRHIVKFMVHLLNPRVGERIYDPFCGTGGMLIESYKYIYSGMEFTSDNIQKLKSDTLYGIELTSNFSIAKMNMILVGDGHSQIKQADSLSANNLEEVKGKFDCIITNFPFSQSTDHYHFYSIPSRSGNSICLQHCIEALKIGGRMAVVLPEVVLFGKTYEKTRKYLFDNCSVDFLISLPKGVFEPYTSVKTSILYCTKGKKADKVWFYEIKQDGFTLDKNRFRLKQRSDLDKFLSFRYVEDKDKPNFNFVKVSLEEIKKNHYGLNLNDYRYKNIVFNSFYPMKKLGTVAKCYRSKLITKKQMHEQPGKYKVYGANGVIGYFHTYMYEDEQIVIGACGSCGAVNFTMPKCSVTSNAMVCEIKVDYLIKKYLYYVLRTIDMSSIMTGSAQPQITKSAIERLLVPIPPLEEQRRILRLIDEQEVLIAQNQMLIEESKQKIQTRLESLFK